VISDACWLCCRRILGHWIGALARLPRLRMALSLLTETVLRGFVAALGLRYTDLRRVPRRAPTGEGAI